MRSTGFQIKFLDTNQMKKKRHTQCPYKRWPEQY